MPTSFQRFRYWFGEKTHLADLEVRFVRYFDRLTYRVPAVLLGEEEGEVAFSLGYATALFFCP